MTEDKLPVLSRFDGRNYSHHPPYWIGKSDPSFVASQGVLYSSNAPNHTELFADRRIGANLLTRFVLAHERVNEYFGFKCFQGDYAIEKSYVSRSDLHGFPVEVTSRQDQAMETSLPASAD